MTHEPFPGLDKDNIAMQQELLAATQQEISDRLFVSGSASRILGAQPPRRGALTSVEGTDQLDKLFVPSLSRKNVDGREEQVLHLAVVTEKPNDGRSYAYTTLGEIDEQGFLHVFEGIPENDAWEVYREAQGLQALKSGDPENPPALPHLEYGLLRINNPFTGITRIT